MKRRTCGALAALVLPAFTAAATEGQVVERPFRCGTTIEVSDVPPPAIDYQLIEAPAGAATEIGVLFLYTDRFTASQVRSRLRECDSAVFRFFGQDNLEVFTKVLNGCAIDDTFRAYASGLTDLPKFVLF